MNKRRKQIIIAIVMNVLCIPPLYLVFRDKKSITGWIILGITYLFLIIVLSILKVWDPDILHKAAWQEEGFPSFSAWFSESRTFDAKLCRFSIKIFLPILIGLSVLVGIAIKITR